MREVITKTKSKLSPISSKGSAEHCLALALTATLLMVNALSSHAQNVNVRTNLLYWCTTTPNVSAEWKLAEKLTLSGTFGYNAFDFPNNASGVNPKLHHWLVMPELKRWLCRSFERGYFGFHAFYMRFNAGGLEFPSFLSDYRYEGFGAGAGVSYGYQWALGKRWGIEASLGVGYVFLQYDKYELGSCGDNLGREQKHYALPTKAALSVVYYIR